MATKELKFCDFKDCKNQCDKADTFLFYKENRYDPPETFTDKYELDLCEKHKRVLIERLFQALADEDKAKKVYQAMIKG